MGTWDVGIFDDDVAMDIQAEFEEAIEEGLSVIEATEQILESFEEELEDEDDAPIIYLALASLQLKNGNLQKSIKDKAIAIIDSGEELKRWAETDEETLEKRKSVLNELKSKLMK